MKRSPRWEILAPIADAAAKAHGVSVRKLDLFMFEFLVSGVVDACRRPHRRGDAADMKKCRALVNESGAGSFILDACGAYEWVESRGF